MIHAIAQSANYKFYRMKPVILFCSLILILSCNEKPAGDLTPKLSVSDNHRYLMTENGDPFFWLGDTGWLLFSKLSREEAVRYLDDRRQKGFNVIQVMVLHDVMKAVNFYGDSALVSHRADKPNVTPGDSADNSDQYDFWDHVDYIVNQAHQRGIYMAMVPVWGSNVRSGRITKEQARKYAEWLADRYKDEPNIIWLNGGDVKGSDSTGIWRTIGSAIRNTAPGQLITFHPFGRTQSSEWFHNEPWLDFNMFQSGHRRYDQDTTGLAYGEDNWKYMVSDYNKLPVKPSLDGEPSYESIPQGLHDPKQPYWTDNDIRRYAYWSVFAGGCGFTYGHNAIMQFHKKGDSAPAYGVKEYWEDAMNAPGASQMIHLKTLLLSRPYFERIPAQDLIAGVTGEKYDYIAATRGNDYAYFYTWNGRHIGVNTQKLQWKEFNAAWFDPGNGSSLPIGTFKADGVKTFDPRGKNLDGNDWVLVLDRI
jgi:hypothetical protein